MIRAALLAVCLSLFAAPVLAQTSGSDGADEMQESLELFSEGARRLLEGLQQDLQPLLEDLSERIDDLNAYEAPEILPNGDILIRRKPRSDPPELDKNGPEPENPIEL